MNKLTKEELYHNNIDWAQPFSKALMNCLRLSHLPQSKKELFAFAPSSLSFLGLLLNPTVDKKALYIVVIDFDSLLYQRMFICVRTAR